MPDLLRAAGRRALGSAEKPHPRREEGTDKGEEEHAGERRAVAPVREEAPGEPT